MSWSAMRNAKKAYDAKSSVKKTFEAERPPDETPLEKAAAVATRASDATSAAAASSAAALGAWRARARAAWAATGQRLADARDSSADKCRATVADARARWRDTRQTLGARAKAARQRGVRPGAHWLTPRVLLVFVPSDSKRPWSGASAALSARNLPGSSVLLCNASRLAVDEHDAALASAQVLHVPLCGVGDAEPMRPPPVEPLLAVCPTLESWLAADSKNVVVLAGVLDVFHVDVLAATLLLFTRFTSDARTALAYVAHVVEHHDYLPPSASFERVVHFAAAKLRRERPSNSAPLRLRFAIVHSAPPIDAEEGACRPVFEVLTGPTDDAKALAWSNVAGGVESSFELATAQRFCAARGDTSMPFQLTPPPLIDSDFGVRATHVTVRNGAVREMVPLFSAWHHASFVDGDALVLRLASSQVEVSDALAPLVDDEFAIDLMFAPDEDSDENQAERSRLQRAQASLRLPQDDERAGGVLFPGGVDEAMEGKRAFAAFTERELAARAQQAAAEQRERAKRAAKEAEAEAKRREREDPVAARHARRVEHARRLRDRFQVFNERFGLPSDEIPFAAFSCGYLAANTKRPVPGTLFVSMTYLAFAASFSKRDLVFPLRDVSGLSDEQQSKLYRNCITVTITDEEEHVFVWVERANKYNADLASAEKARKAELRESAKKRRSAAAAALNEDNVDDNDEDPDEADGLVRRRTTQQHKRAGSSGGAKADASDNDSDEDEEDADMRPVDVVERAWRDCQEAHDMRLAMGSGGTLTRQRDLLNKRDMQVLMLGGTYRKLKRGQPLMLAGERCESFFKIVKGKAKVYVPATLAQLTVLANDASSDSENTSLTASADVLTKNSSGKKKKHRFKTLRRTLTASSRRSADLSKGELDSLRAAIATEDSKQRSRQSSTRSAAGDDSEGGAALAEPAGSAAPATGAVKLTADECGVYLGQLGEANLPGELAYALHDSCAVQTVVADGKLEVHEVPFSYFEQQLAQPTIEQGRFAARMFRTMARSLAARLHAISSRNYEMLIRQLRAGKASRFTRWSLFNNALLPSSLVAALPKSDGRAVPPTECAWREPSAKLDVHGVLWATPACVCFTAQLFGFGTRQLLPISELVAVRRRGSTELELELEHSQRYVFVGFEDRDSVVEALLHVIETHKRATGREVTLVRHENNSDVRSKTPTPDIVVVSPTPDGAASATATAATTEAPVPDRWELTPEDWRLLLAGARVETFARGECIVRQGSTACAIRQVVSGRMLVVSERNNKHVAIGALRDGALFGELSFCTGVPATATVYAETSEVAVYVFEAAWLHAAFMVAPRLRARFYRHLALALAARVKTAGAIVATEMSRAENSDAALDAAEKQLAAKYDKLVQRFYYKPPLPNNEWPLLVHEAPCTYERRLQKHSGRLYVSFDTALYFRAERSTFGKPLTLTLEYDRMAALRIVGERSSDMRTLEFELLAKESPHAKALQERKEKSPEPKQSGGDAPADDDDEFERHCFTFASVDERRAFWDVLHKYCPKMRATDDAPAAQASDAAAPPADSNAPPAAALRRRRSSVGSLTDAAELVARRRSSDHNNAADASKRSAAHSAITADDAAGLEDDLASTTLTASEWQFLVSSVRVERVPLGAELMRGGDANNTARSGAPRRLYQIASGSVKAVRINMRTRQQAVLGEQHRGAIVGELALVLGGAPLASIVAHTDNVTVYAIDSSPLRELLALRPALGAAFHRRLLGAMARRLAYSFHVMAAPKSVVLPIEPIANAPIVRSGALQRRGKSKWKLVQATLHADALLVLREPAGDAKAATSGTADEADGGGGGKSIDLSGFSVSVASVKTREHVLRLTHALRHEVLLQAASIDECGEWLSALNDTIRSAAREQRQGLVETTRRKVDVRFSEKFNVPATETVLVELECKAMRVTVPRRASRASAVDAIIKSAAIGRGGSSSRKRAGRGDANDEAAIKAFNLPRDAVPATLKLSANYIGVHAKKAKYTKAIYLHGMTSEPELDDERGVVRMMAGGLEYEWAEFPMRTDAARLHETLMTYMSINADDDALTVAAQRQTGAAAAAAAASSSASRLSADDWQHIVSACDARTRAYERDFVVLRQGHRSDAIYMVELGRMRVVVDNRQVATIEEGELFGAESFFGVSGSDFEIEARDWSSRLANKVVRGSHLLRHSRTHKKKAKAAAAAAAAQLDDDDGDTSSSQVEETDGAAAGTERGKVLPYSVVCDSPRAVVSVLRGEELRALLRLDASLRLRFLQYATTGLARRVRIASTESLRKTIQTLASSGGTQ